MKVFVAGIGSGNYDLITLSALEHAKHSDIIIVPSSKLNTEGIAEKVIRHHMPEKIILPVYFPMIKSEIQSEANIKVIHEQLILHDWTDIQNIFFPVLGDVTLYSTAEYLIEAFRMLDANIETEFISGISAHSTASSCVKRFLAMRDEIFTVISGTSEPERIISALKVSDCSAIYKPKAISKLRDIIEASGKFSKIVRVDFAGIPERERIIEGYDALDEVDEYISIILLWK